MESHPDNATTFRPRHISLLARKLSFSLVITLVSPALISVIIFFHRKSWLVNPLFVSCLGCLDLQLPFQFKKVYHVKLQYKQFKYLQSFCCLDEFLLFNIFQIERDRPFRIVPIWQIISIFCMRIYLNSEDRSSKHSN